MLAAQWQSHNNITTTLIEKKKLLVGVEVCMTSYFALASVLTRPRNQVVIIWSRRFASVPLRRGHRFHQFAFLSLLFLLVPPCFILDLLGGMWWWQTNKPQTNCISRNSRNTFTMVYWLEQNVDRHLCKFRASEKYK